MKNYEISAQVLTVLLNYLKKRPFEEVAGMISHINGLKEIKHVSQDNGTSDTPSEPAK